MPLLASDQEFLVEKGYDFEVAEVGAMLHVILHGFPLPAAYLPRSVDLLIRLPAGYPNAQPDMFWTSPQVTLANGQSPNRADVNEPHGGRTWQRWSRHWATPWRPGVDGLNTFLTSIHSELAKGADHHAPHGHDCRRHVPEHGGAPSSRPRS